MGGLYDEVRAALHAIWIRRWIALGVAWVICLGGWLVVSQIANQYESRARVFVELRQLLPSSNGQIQADQRRDIDRVRQTLTSAVNLEKVVRGTGLANTVATERDLADRIAGLRDIIKITAQQDNLFEISATMANPSMSDAQNAKLARSIVQKMIDIFVEDNLSEDRNETAESLRFLDQQLAQRQQQLQEAESKKAEFAARYLGSLPGTGSLDDRIAAARAQMGQIDSEIASARTGLAAVNGQMSGTPATIAGSGGTAGPARARVQAIQGQLAEARGRGWTDSHPDVIALKAQLGQAQAAARNEPVYGGGGSANPMYSSLRAMQAEKSATVASLIERKAQIQSDLDLLQQKLNDSPEVAAEQAEIDRNYQVLKAQYDKLLTAVLVVGLLGGVGAAFGLSRIRTSFETAGRLERATGMPVIGSIGEFLTDAQISLRRRRLQLFLGGGAALAAAYVALVGLEFFQRGMVA